MEQFVKEALALIELMNAEQRERAVAFLRMLVSN